MRDSKQYKLKDENKCTSGGITITACTVTEKDLMPSRQYFLLFTLLFIIVAILIFILLQTGINYTTKFTKFTKPYETLCIRVYTMEI